MRISLYMLKQILTKNVALFFFFLNLIMQLMMTHTELKGDESS